MPIRRRKPEKPRKASDRAPRNPTAAAPQGSIGDDEIDAILAQLGLTVPFPRGHPYRARAANAAVLEFLRSNRPIIPKGPVSEAEPKPQLPGRPSRKRQDR